MLKLKFEGTHGCPGYKSFVYIHTFPDHRGWLTTQSSVHSCREFFIKSYRDKITKDSSSTPWAKRAYALVAFGMARLNNFNGWEKQLRQNSEKGLYILNSFERSHKWPLTKLYPVECKNMPCVFFSGSRKWTMSPYLMSIWSMGIRMGRNQWLPEDLLTLDHKKLVAAMIRNMTGKSNADALQLRHSIKEWNCFMALYPDLFKGNTRKYHWNTNHLSQDDRPEGIKRLMTGATSYKKLHKRYFELKEARKLK